MSAILSWTIALWAAYHGTRACFSCFPGSGVGLGLGNFVCHMSCEAVTRGIVFVSLLHYLIFPPKHTLLYFSF